MAKIQFNVELSEIILSCYNDRKKRAIFKYFIFMSFSPIDFMFIGSIGYKVLFCWVLRNFDFKPTNEIFLEKCTIQF